MVKVENRPVLDSLALRFLKVNFRRYILAIISIVLTTLLFTTLFTGALSMFLTKLEADKKAYLTTSHATIQQLSQEEADRAKDVLSSCDFVTRFGADQLVGVASDNRFPFVLEFHCADMAAAENRLALPTAGRMPEAGNEIAVSTQVLDALGISHILGNELTVKVQHGTDSALTDETFSLCGFWEGDTSDVFQWGWVSGEYALDTLPSEPASGDQSKADASFGSWTFSIWYDNVFKIREYSQMLGSLTGLETSGRTGDGFRPNPAYLIAFDFGEGSISLLSVVLLALLILLAGYLIIYNIFNISVKNDIRTYGLLKNVGTTGKQLKSVVRRQALALCAIGIPIGLPYGYAVGLALAPAVSTTLENTDASLTVVTSAHPLIFVTAALFALFTVYLSSLQACRIVRKLSPVEALRMADADDCPRVFGRCLFVSQKIPSCDTKNAPRGAACQRRAFRTDRNEVKTRNGVETELRRSEKFFASAWGMAVQNTIRNRRQGIVVVLSVMLSLATLYYVSIATGNMDFQEFAGIYLDAGDFQLDKLAFGAGADYDYRRAISPDMQDALNSCLYSQSTGYVYLTEASMPMNDHIRTIFENITAEHLSKWSGGAKQTWETARASNLLPVHYLGITRAVFDKLTWLDEACSWEEFCSGGHALVRRPNRYLKEGETYFQNGESFEVQFDDGASRTYTMLGEVSMPYSLGYPYAYLTGIEVLVPAGEYIRCTGDSFAMKALIDAIPGQEERVGKYLDDTILSKDSTIKVTSVLKLKETYDNYVNRYYMIGGLLSLVLAFIGIMNFFNTTATTVLSRKKELALLEATGMTGRQLRWMLTAEGCMYLGCALAGALALTFGYCGYTFHLSVSVLAGRIMLPGLATLPILLLTAWGIPCRQFQKMRQESLADRLRE